MNAKVCDLFARQQQFRRQPALHTQVDVVYVLDVERLIIPDIGHDKPLVLFRIDVGAVAPACAHSAYIDIQQDSAVLILAVLRV